MSFEPGKRPPDPFGDDEDILDINCRPAAAGDIAQVAFLTLGLLNKLFSPHIATGDVAAQEIIESAIRSRLRLDCTWVMTEGDTVIGMIDLETLETRRLNGQPVHRILVDRLELGEKVHEAGLLPLLVHEPSPEECHQPLVALLPGSRGEGRGTLLLMHGAFWAKAQGKHWMTSWLPENDPSTQVYIRRGYKAVQELEVPVPEGPVRWKLFRKPISQQAYKELRMEEEKGK